MNSNANLKDIDYGPLKQLIGVWEGGKGVDVAPEDDGEETNFYQETLTFEPARDLDNAEEQCLVVLKYHQVVIRKSDGKMIHNETGYYSWDSEGQTLIKSFAIPRGIAVVAGGTVTQENDASQFAVKAGNGNADWGIVESPFMQKNASTKGYQFSMSVNGNELSYSQVAAVEVYGRSFEHTDQNVLTRN
ncbi:heme-binding beta-barrel domain-containing protein [Aliikangiella coralliicola]|uniref:DUF1794 domain-containing protein n=1 Tax=Aliikangiella coralliicola TaxID=2592383 RepID=A0A545UF91_9GAMM|nr:heme-binding beta-barrel domain-containing protein [Aliikangiella coralliicola]TQV88142.1 DUF1794 domain-containing protein [Aliikangiella coralliicola]